MTKFTEIREFYPATTRSHYFDTSTTGIIPIPTLQAITGLVEKRCQEGMSIEEYWNMWSNADVVRAKVAKMMNASESEIFFGKDASDMLNIFAIGLVADHELNIVVPSISFPSTRNVWLNREKDGVEVKYVPAVDGVVTEKMIVEAIDDQTMVLSICSVEPSTGYAYDMEYLGNYCHERDIYFVVDATQGFGAMPIDVKAMHIDYLVTSTYKWMCNVFGIAIGYINKEVLSQVMLNHAGWAGARDRMQDFNNPELTMNTDAKRFETGGLNWNGLVGLEVSTDIYLALGAQDIKNQIEPLIEKVYQGIGAIDGIKVEPALTPLNRSSILYLTVADKIDSLTEAFAKSNIRANISGNRIRIGIHFYNNEADIEELLAACKSVL